MATISQLRAGLKTRLATISGLRAYDKWPGNVTPPGAIVMPVDGEYDQVMGDNPDTVYKFEVTLAVQLGSYETAQDKLDEYVNPAGARSVRAAINGDRTLGGVADATWVRRFREYGTLDINGKDYAGVIFDVEVSAR